MNPKNQNCLFLLTIFSFLTLTNQIFANKAIFPSRMKTPFEESKKTKRSTVSSTKRSSSDPAALSNIASALLIAKIPTILDNTFYKKTHPGLFKNILHAPLFAHSTTKNKKPGWKFNLFLNINPIKDFTETNNGRAQKLSSYLNLDDQNIIGAFDQAKTAVTMIVDFDDFNIPDLFNVFAPMKLQENRLGVVAEYHKKWNNIFVNVKLPFLWAERNFNFTQAEKELIYTNDLIKRFEVVDEWEFARKYMISDQLGFGTLETTFGTHIVKNDAGGIEAGVTLHFPTEFALKKGLLGTYRELVDEQPVLDFCELFTQDGGVTKGTSNWQDTISNYLENAFTRFTSNLLNVPLGFNGHPGIEVYLSPTWNINHRWTWKSSYSFEIFIPVYQNRLIIESLKSETEISDVYNNEPSNEKKIKLVQQVISDRLYPELSKSLIMPGAIFNSSSCFHYTRGNKTFSFGSSTWVQLREQMYSHSLSPEVQWDIAAAELPWASQSKIFCKIEKTIQKEFYDLLFGFYADYTAFNHAMGNDFLINFEIKGKF